ncbi:hypothetical protein HAX54_017368 [Datura stramonium]|uniref:Uncharacterized protein n=1 Tax=Datura stramonium TaxID=4076 RepID=A0ABS8S0H0_DATST|nr:hypothetical protein [Datura stramonium]
MVSILSTTTPHCHYFWLLELLLPDSCNYMVLSFAHDRAAADSDGPNLGLVGSDFIDEKGTNYSIDDSVDSEGGLVGYDDENYECFVCMSRRERSNVLKDIMGDHIVEFGRILDYKNELLRTNPESTCVVKLGRPNAFGKPVF